MQSVGRLAPGRDDHQAEEENEEREESPEVEESDARPLRAPFRPTLEMSEDHTEHGQSLANRRVEKYGEPLLTILVDYGFFGTPESSAHELPILVVKDRWSQCVWSHLVPSRIFMV